MENIIKTKDDRNHLVVTLTITILTIYTFYLS